MLSYYNDALFFIVKFTFQVVGLKIAFAFKKDLKNLFKK